MHATVDIRNNSVVIIGPPASGKTYLANKLALDNPNHRVIHTDDYIKYGFEGALYHLLEDIVKLSVDRPLIIEGVLGYRLLRKGVQLNCFYPDMVIELEITSTQLERIYKTVRDRTKLDAVRTMCKANETVLRSYQLLQNERPPKWIKLKNSY